MPEAGHHLGPGGGQGPVPAAPGAVYPLRRMQLNDVFAAGFRMLRHSPRTMLGIPLAAALLNFLLSLALMALPASGALSRMAMDPMAFEDPELVLSTFTSIEFLLFMVVSMLFGQLLLGVAAAVISLPTLRAAYGFRTGFGQALRLRARRLPALCVHYLVLLLIAVLAGAAVIAVVAAAVWIEPLLAFAVILLLFLGFLPLVGWLTAGLMYGPIAVLVEDKGPVAAVGRSWGLNRGIWWRNIGTVLLLFVMILALTLIISIPAGIAMGVGEATAWDSADPVRGTTTSLLIFAGTSLFDAVLTALAMGLFGGIVTAMYLNCRVRREALDVALLSAAPSSPDDGRIVPASAEHLGRPQPAQPHYGQPPYGQPPYGHAPYGQAPYGQQPPHGSASPYGSGPYGSGPYGPPPGQTGGPGQDDGGFGRPR